MFLLAGPLAQGGARSTLIRKDPGIRMAEISAERVALLCTGRERNDTSHRTVGAEGTKRTELIVGAYAGSLQCVRQLYAKFTFRADSCLIHARHQQAYRWPRTCDHVPTSRASVGIDLGGGRRTVSTRALLGEEKGRNSDDQGCKDRPRTTATGHFDLFRWVVGGKCTFGTTQRTETLLWWL